MELLILSQMKLENISEFSLLISIGISECGDALFSFNNLICFSFLKTDLLKTRSTIPITFSSDRQNARVLFVFKNSF